MGVEHDIVCIDCFGVLICTTGDVLWLCEKYTWWIVNETLGLENITLGVRKTK